MAIAAALDAAPEHGGSQRALWSPEVSEGLQAIGVDVTEQLPAQSEVIEDEEPVDSEDFAEEMNA